MNYETKIYLTVIRGLKLVRQHLKYTTQLGRQIDYVLAIGNEAGIKAVTIAERLEIRQTTAQVSLRLLCKKGLLYKENKLYYLTGEGQKIYDTIAPPFKVALNEYSAALIKKTNREYFNSKRTVCKEKDSILLSRCNRTSAL